MIDFREIPSDGETWELFARDFLQEIGFFVESGPDRGADRGRDILVTEQLKGHIGKYRFRWLVSCKHFAHSGKAVSANSHEQNILDRLRSLKADGFIGFYSTIASSGLTSLLDALKDESHIHDYRIFDHKLIENYLIRIGFSRLLIRYLPESYKNVAPIHLVLDEYVPIKCDLCDKDLLKAMYEESYVSLIGQVKKYDKEEGKSHIVEMYFACKGKCDETISKKLYEEYNETTAWKDLSDLVIPAEFIRWTISTINQLSSGKYVYSEKAIEKERQLIFGLSQKVLREMTESERKRFRDLFRYSI